MRCRYAAREGRENWDRGAVGDACNEEMRVVIIIFAQ